MSQSSTPALLQVRDLSKSYGGIHALSKVSFDVHAGQMMALIGPNGAGKSTCFNALGGQLKADSGSVRLNDHELLGLTPEKICRLGVGRSFQTAATFRSMSVLENIQLALLSHDRRLFNGWRRAAAYKPKAALDVLALVGMADHARQTCGTLAYGDVKRVELAIALAQRPSLLLMDEPTAGMSRHERHCLMDLIQHLADTQQLAVVFTEHSLDVVFKHADHIAVLVRGNCWRREHLQLLRPIRRFKRRILGSMSDRRTTQSLTQGIKVALPDPCLYRYFANFYRACR